MPSTTSLIMGLARQLGGDATQTLRAATPKAPYKLTDRLRNMPTTRATEPTETINRSAISTVNMGRSIPTTGRIKYQPPRSGKLDDTASVSNNWWGKNKNPNLSTQTTGPFSRNKRVHPSILERLQELNPLSRLGQRRSLVDRLRDTDISIQSLPTVNPSAGTQTLRKALTDMQASTRQSLKEDTQRRLFGLGLGSGVTGLGITGYALGKEDR